jgi:peptide/nickel transport system ATP-binding protein
LSETLLEVRGLSAEFVTPDRPRHPVQAVNDVHLKIAPGETVGLVGESGCGKSTLAQCLLRLIPPPGRIVKGQILWKGEDLLSVSDDRVRSIRGKEIALVFQEVSAVLNPVLTMGDQVGEPLRIHRHLSRRDAWREAGELLRSVQISDPESRLRDYPHQLSGGMKQRVLIAMALACSPDLLIADEPTRGLDVTIQAQILELLRSLKERHGLAMLLISHDLGVVAQNTDRVAVMYAGRIVEEAPADSLFEDPKHPYTTALLRSLPGRAEAPGKRRWETIPGTVPDLRHLPPGCAFAPRCPLEFDTCRTAVPPLGEVSRRHFAACYAYPSVVSLVEDRVPLA